MDYQNYTVIDFILNEAFFQWVRYPNEISDKYWNEWFPYQREEVEEARYWILLFKTLEEEPPAFQLEKEDFWQQIMIESRKKKPDRQMIVPGNPHKR